MKSLLEEGESLSITTEEETNSDFKQKEKSLKNLFNHIDKLAADHNVTVSNTMIKVTYKKALKDHCVNKEPIIIENMNTSEIRRKKAKETVNLCNIDVSLVPNSVKSQSVAKVNSVFHSTPKEQPLPSEKKREFVNGLNLTLKQNHCENESIANLSYKSQTPNTSVNKLNSFSTPIKLISKKSLNTGKGNNFNFLKDFNLVRVNDSIISKDGGLSKPKKSNIKMTKLENGVKSKGEGSLRISKKILKRNSSDTKVGVSGRKIKSENKSKTMETTDKKLEESNKSGGSKKAIMLVDPELPSGWTRFIRTKNKGSANEQHVVYVVSPQGKKFRFKWKLRKFLERTNSSLNADQFFFGLYKRPKSSSLPESERNESREMSKREKASAVQLKNSRKTLKETTKASDQLFAGDADKISGKVFGADGRELLLFDPDLPFGWKRIIHSNSSSGRQQVHIISPEGRIFRRRYRLHEYLTKHQYTHTLDRFYFGLYPKKEGSGNGSESPDRDSEGIKTLDVSKEENDTDRESYSSTSEEDDESNEFIMSETDKVGSPMFDDPNLPEGWKRFLKIRDCGDSVGRMEVVIVSPDGRRHRSRGHLEQYLQQQNLDYKSKDFDFTVSGKSNLGRKRMSSPEPRDVTVTVKKKSTAKPVPPLDLSSLKDVEITAEGQMINTVAGLMLSCGLSSARSERRLRVPRREHEKILSGHLNSEMALSSESCQIPTHWVQKLVKCRSDFRMLEPDAVVTVAEKTKDFLTELCRRALSVSENPECGVRYEDLADVVNKSECLSPLKTLIPKKISYREFVRLNRPKQFLSFT